MKFMLSRQTMRVVALCTAASLTVAACGSTGSDSTGSDSTGSDSTGVEVTLLTYDSFPESGTSVNDALDAFSARTGIKVKILSAGDTGTMVSKAVLTSGNPEGDVMWGVDQTFLTQALDGQVFAPVPALVGVSAIDVGLREGTPEELVVPVNFGDVCINYDIGWFTERGIPVPLELSDLTDPVYAGQLVVQNPATSSPGLAMLLATVATFGETEWIEWWEQMAANGIQVTNGWTEAYYERFTWAGGGDQPMVVSYGSSPPAEVLFAEPARDDAPTAVIENSCFRQVEFAGVLRGTSQPEAAQQLLEFLISEEFQAELALNLFVFPANTNVELPEVFTAHAVIPARPLSLDPELIQQRRSEWIEEWTARVLR
jgi:thiamine transport system substrate-binding protein